MTPQTHTNNLLKIINCYNNYVLKTHLFYAVNYRDG